MTNWQEIVDGIEAPKDLTPSQWLALQGPDFAKKCNSLALGSPLEVFLAKYHIAKLGSSKVEVTLPAGISRIDFFAEAQELSVQLHKTNRKTYQTRQVVDTNTFADWKSDARFNQQIMEKILLIIDGNVTGSTNMTRQEQKAQGWNNVAIEDLAVAHTSFYLLNGMDLFGENIVRAFKSALFFNISGLVSGERRGDDRYSDVSASRSLLVPN